MLSRFRLVQNFETLQNIRGNFVSFLFEKKCTVLRAMDIFDEAKVPGNAARKRRIRRRLGHALEHRTRDVAVFITESEQHPEGVLFLEIESNVNQSGSYDGHYLIESLGFLESPTGQSTLILTWETNSFRGTSIGKETVVQLGSFTIDEAAKSFEDFKRLFSKEELNKVFLVAPKQPKEIRATILQQCFGDSKVVLEKPLAEDQYLWEQPILSHKDHFQYAGVAVELAALDQLQTFQESSYLVVKGLANVVEALDKNRVDTLLVSDRLTAVRDVYNTIPPTDTPLVVLREAADDRNVAGPEIIQDMLLRKTSSSTYLKWLSTCDQCDINQIVIIITNRTTSGRIFQDTCQIAALLKGWRKASC